MKIKMLSLFLLAGLLIACAPQVAATQTAPEQLPTLNQQPTSTPNEVPTVAPIDTQQMLPLCPADAGTSCALPTAEERSRFCVKKIPYTLYALPKGTTFEVITPDFTCKDEGIRSGVQMISCTGKPLYSFKARICATGCAAGLPASSQCAQGYGLDATQNCCAPMPATDGGCAEVTLQVGACP